jgi:hemerythrin
MVIEWNDSLATGNTDIDSQHRELFSRFATLLTACQEKKGREEVLRLLGFLDDYVKSHFALEEQLMLAHDYPDLGQHKAQHDRFVLDLHHLKHQLADEGATLMLVIKTNQTMAGWLINHINAVDRHLAAYLRPRL